MLVEHFTNTYCSVCASKNHGFYANLWRYPQVWHVAYHPSSPYAACPLSMANVPENDARTNYYGVYGGTPRLVIQGAVVTSTNYADSAIVSIFNWSGEKIKQGGDWAIYSREMLRSLILQLVLSLQRMAMYRLYLPVFAVKFCTK